MNIRLLAFIGLSAFVALAVFGFAAMTGEMNAHGDCLASIANNGCPLPAAGPAMAVFHVNAYQAFSTAILTFFFVAFLLFSAFGFGLVEVFLQRSRQRRERKFALSFLTHESAIYKFRHWLFTREKKVPAFSN